MYERKRVKYKNRLSDEKRNVVKFKCRNGDHSDVSFHDSKYERTESKGVRPMTAAAEEREPLAVRADVCVVSEKYLIQFRGDLCTRPVNRRKMVLR